MIDVYNPELLIQTIESPWFGQVDILGTIAFAISAVCIAYQKRITVFGTMVLALVPSLGGGLIRDLILRQYPLNALRTPKFILTIVLTVLISYFFIRLAKRFQTRFKIFRKYSFQTSWLEKIIVVTDAIGLACFLLSGILVSILANVYPLWLWGPFFAFITGAAGKILRDLMVKNKTIASPQGGMYGEVAVVWGLFLSWVFLNVSSYTNPGYIKFMMAFTIFGAFFTRVFIYFFKIPNLYFKS